jgi:hypothetical protein
MSMYLLLKTVIKRMDKNRRKFFWQGGESKEKIPSDSGRKYVGQRRRVAWGLKT